MPIPIYWLDTAVVPSLTPLICGTKRILCGGRAADVQTYYSSELVTRYEQGSDFASGKIHVSFPITAPKYNSTTFEDVPYSGPNAVDQELPYWGLPNGVEGYAEMFVRIKNNTTQQVFTKEITSIQEPLMLKDCPFLIQDPIRTEISIQEILTAASSASDFNGGDEVEISAMVSLVHSSEKNRTVVS